MITTLHKDDGCHHGTQQDAHADLDQQDQGKSETERGFSDLVVKEEHSENRSDASSYNGDCEQDSFRDPETPLHCPDLVRCHGSDSQKVDKDTIYNEYHSCEHV